MLATWHQLVDEGALQDGEPYLAGTGRMSVARVSPATAKRLGLEGVVTITGKRRGALDLPLVVTAGHGGRRGVGADQVARHHGSPRSWARSPVTPSW